MNATAIADGFTPFSRSSPLLDLLGPIYARGTGLQLELGLLTDSRHANAAAPCMGVSWQH
jgi:hypothetical protein